MLRRYSTFIVVLALAAVPLLVYGVYGALGTANNDVRQWLPAGFEETRQYDWFLDRFGSEEMLVASWDGCNLDDPRLERLAAGLAPYVEGESDGGGSAEGPAYFRRVMTGPSALQELTSEPISLHPAEALRRLQGTLIGPDGRTSGLVITVGAAGAADRHAAVEAVYRVAQQEAGLSRDELRLGGPTIDSVALDSESQRSRYLLSVLSIIVSLALAWRCLSQWRLVAAVFATAIFCAGVSISIVYVTGGTMSLLLVMMPTLVYVLAISAAVHLAGYYRDAVEKVGVEEAPAKAVADGWMPCALTALTTALGLGSLGVSEVVPVKMFGIYSAAGILVSLPIVLVLLPALLQLWPVRPLPRSEFDEPAAGELLAVLIDRTSRVVLRHHRWFAAAGLALLMFFAAGLLRLETSVKLLNLFSPQSRIIQDYTWLEEHLGPLVPVELVVEFNGTNELPPLDRLQLVSRIKEQIGHMDKVGGTMSAATFVPAVPAGGGIRQTVERAMIDRTLREAADEGRSHFLASEHESQLWRISARVEALNALDYGLFIEHLREQVEPVLASAELQDTRVTYTGVVPLVYKAQRALLNDLMTSFFSAFVLIAVVMVVMLRSVSPGLLTMLPNVFPAVAIFGAMGWLGVLCDIGSMMTASVALGIAVDDTIHFMSWFRRGIGQGLSRHDAIRLAYRRCARAMVQTTIICGLGLLVFAFSSFVPTARFSYLMGTLLVAALVGDLLLLPALLAGPLGRLFERGRQPLAESLEVTVALPQTGGAAALPVRVAPAAACQAQG